MLEAAKAENKTTNEAQEIQGHGIGNEIQIGIITSYHYYMPASWQIAIIKIIDKMYYPPFEQIHYKLNKVRNTFTVQIGLPVSLNAPLSKKC